MKSTAAKEQELHRDEFPVNERSAINARLDKALVSENWHKVDSDYWANVHKDLDELAKNPNK